MKHFQGFANLNSLNLLIVLGIEVVMVIAVKKMKFVTFNMLILNTDSKFL